MIGEQAMLERLERLEAIEAVRLLKARYWTSLDAVDLDAVRACFADDAVIEMEGVPPCDGPDGYLRYLRDHHAGGGAGGMGLHSGQNPRIEIVSPDRATGIWDQHFVGLAPSPDGGPMGLLRLTGIYHDEYRRLDDGWRISAMRFRQTSFVMLPLAEGGVAARSSADFFGS